MWLINFDSIMHPDKKQGTAIETTEPPQANACGGVLYRFAGTLWGIDIRCVQNLRLWRWRWHEEVCHVIRGFVRGLLLNVGVDIRSHFDICVPEPHLDFF